MHYVIKRPLVTEKTSRMAEQGVYAFEVERKASKTDIRQAVEKFFRVKVQDVNTSVCRSRSRRTKLGVSKAVVWKKAMVRLKKGEKITLFEGA
jgi:large subunit ribosomal protein L23